MIKVKRFDEYNGSTVSIIFIDDVEMGYGLEDGFNEPKIKGETRIPAGRYKLKLRTYGGFNARYASSSRIPQGVHKGMIEICDIPNFTDVLIHVGNSKKDTAGCLLVGSSYTRQDTGFFISSSWKAYNKIYPVIADKLLTDNEVWIEFTDPQ